MNLVFYPCISHVITENLQLQVEPGSSTEKTIRLERIWRSEEGQATLFLQIDQKSEFKLHCPLSYPNHQVN